MFRPGKLFLIFTFITLSFFTLTSCNRNLSPEAPELPTQIQPQAPPAPISGEAPRTTYADIVDRVAPAVVMVNVEQRAKPAQQGGELPFLDNPMFREFFKDNPQTQPQPQRPQRGIGSGVIVSADGIILTNNHVIEGADKIRIELNDNRTFEAKVIGTDPLSDLAVVKIDAQNLPFLNLGDSDKVRVGDIILAIGNPLGIGQTVTAGIISAKGRRTGISDGKSFEDFLQIDAPINRGNSGGALVDLRGELIGINSQILSPPGSGGNIGIGFSIPSNMAKSVMEQLVKDGKVRRGMLGINIQNPTEEMREAFGLKDTKGVLVGGVKTGSAADKAGIKRGDIIVAINGEKVEDSNVLRNRIAGTLPGTEITLTVLREGGEQQFKATLDELQSENSPNSNSAGEDKKEPEKSAEGGKLGLELQPLTPDLAQRLKIPDAKGMLITSVDPSGAAAEKGVQRGDLLLEINRQEVASFEDVKSALAKSGDRAILLLISRGGQTSYITIQPNG